MQRIEIFRPGTHTAMSGETIGFTEAQLRASAAAYDPTLHEAPIVIGHPRADGPAYGWVKGLRYAESLEAEPDQVEPQFAELVEAGRFKKVSASFYRPDSPSNPVPGVFYLRHVGFLGAQPPAIKGLRQVEFADGAGGDVVELEFSEAMEFGEVNVGVLQRLFRGMRDFLIGKEGIETADRVLPDWAVSDIEDRSRGPAFHESPKTTTQEVSDVDKQELQRKEREIADREAEIARKEASFAERERQDRAAASVQLIEKLVTEGRVLPRHRDGLVAFMASPESEQPLEFGEGAARTKTSARAFLEDFLKELPQSVDYAERGRAEEEPAVGAFQAPQGYEVDPDKARLHQQALAYQESHSCDYMTAVRAVQRKGA
ncbi:hypothetical protein [Bordetella petrii]|uniref:Conserved phage-related protein n=1 Tax=Bordetella petrii (strain ATCC BAA-461 / DSM 12804 / CCUG 43448 / CIP 107267 / Se-1111R) TaxID=340100 RepID=A9ID48_BORPD|nr:hypothetical protein [Bordetella petrii]CAP44762.1 conserved phage-related protein [Bordetella petrii]